MKLKRTLPRLGRTMFLALTLSVCCAAPAGAYLYWSSPNTQSVFRAHVDGSEPLTLFSGAAFGTPAFGGIAVGANHIYWVWQNGIGRANLDGSAPEKEFITGIEGISDVAASGNHLYWSGAGEHIGRANINGSEVEPSFITGILGGAVESVAVNSEYIYWTNFWNSAIGRAKLDGSQIEQEWVKKTHTPMGLAVSSQYVYWAITYENHIGRANINGTEPTTNFITSGLDSNANEDVQLAVYGQHIYWANPTIGSIGRANIDGTEIEPEFITGVGEPLGLTSASIEAVTKPVTEPTTSSATANATVDPQGSEVTECIFEYGTSTSYEHTAPCSPAPGSGHGPVAVSAALTGLVKDSVYHYRVVARSALGTGSGVDETFATLNESATGKAGTPAETAEASVVGASVKATGGTGAVTVGSYGSNKGGPPLANGKGTYFQVFRTAGSTFTKIEYTDCELGGAKTLWWDDPETGWEPIGEPPAVYTESPTPCITVVATASTKPSISQLSDPRHVGGPSASEKLGKCVPMKHGHFEDSGCSKEKYTEKGATRSYKGKYEWLVDPSGACYGEKHGHFEDPACSKEKFKEKQGVKSYKGKYEAASDVVSGSSGMAMLQVPGQMEPALECPASTYSEQPRAANQGVVTIVLTGCERQGVKCESGSEEGRIQSAPLETYLYEEAGQLLTVLAGKQMLSFKCATAAFVLSGTVAGQLEAAVNIPITHSEASFGESIGAQELELEETKNATRDPVTLKTSFVDTVEQPMEIKAR